MNLANIAIEPIFSILIGILILVVPRFLSQGVRSVKNSLIVK